MEQTIEEPPAHTKTKELRLTEDAIRILLREGGVQAFREKYGDYSVYGTVSKARFSAICKIVTSSKETRDRMQTSLSVDVADTAEAAAAFERTTKNSNEVLTINVHSDINRIKGSPRQEGSSVKATNIVSAFENFQKNYDCVPQTALLCHYSFINHRIPLAQHFFESLDKELAILLQALYISQTQLLASPMI